jgi:hypothetical protein
MLEPKKNTSIRKIRFTIESVEWQKEPVENIIGTCALFDVAAKQKISEECHFSLKKDTSPILNVIFEVSHPNSEIVLLIKLEKPFQGDINEWIDLYNKGKCNSQSKTFGYNQNFGMMCYFVYDRDILGDYNKSQPGENFYRNSTNWFYRQDEFTEIWSFFLASRLPSKKMKSIPVKMNITLSETIATSNKKENGISFF